MTVPAPAAPETDEDLAARAAAGDEPAFESLVLRYQDRAHGLACRLVGPGSDAQDVLQEAFLSVYRHLGSFRGQARFSTWLYRIVTNAALMQRRARRRRPAESLEAFLPRFDAGGRHLGEPADLEAAAHVEESLDHRTLAARAHEGIERLPELYREAFVLRDLEEMTTAEVAEVLGVSAEVVRQRVHRARLMLRGYLGAAVGGRR
ncbi:MAG TPA: sigma-70 family RNA polymerase sigma factor [Vicinamibacteria bacterium]|nr:sigma-70 family RNA polymerase sigma factor [Vicinamibacteria bacterium]